MRPSGPADPLRSSFHVVATRWLSALVGLCLLAAACTTESAQLVPPEATTTTTSILADEEPPTTTTTSVPGSPPTSDPQTPPADENNPLPEDEPEQGEVPPFEAEPPPPLPVDQEPEGLIAMIGNDGDLLILEPTGTQVAELTDHDDQRVSQPTWSPDAEFVAWTELPTVDSPTPKLAINTPDADRGATIDTPFPSFFNAWNPEGTRIAMLGASARGVDIAFVGSDEGALSADEIAADGGQPYFFDWVGPDTVYSHVGAEVRTLDLGDAGPGGAGSSLGDPEILGTEFAAPDVLSDGTAIVVDDTSGTPVLERRSLDGSSVTPLAELTGAAFVVVDPTESFVAVHVLGELVAAPPTTVTAWRQPDTSELPVLGGGVWVYELSSGQAFQVADEERRGLFWDPSGTRLLMLAPDGELARWQVWSIDGSSRFTNLAEMSPVLLDTYLPFADQYARSITFWSPDGSSFVYSAVADDGFLSIFVHNASRNGVSTEIAKGPVAIWSPAGGGGAGNGSRL